MYLWHIYFNFACIFFLWWQVKLVNIRNDDITDGNPKLTLGLIWTIILHFQVSLVLLDCMFLLCRFLHSCEECWLRQDSIDFMSSLMCFWRFWWCILFHDVSWISRCYLLISCLWSERKIASVLNIIKDNNWCIPSSIWTYPSCLILQTSLDEYKNTLESSEYFFHSGSAAVSILASCTLSLFY